MKECKLKDYIENANFEETGFSYTLSLISGKSLMKVLDQLCIWGTENRK